MVREIVVNRHAAYFAAHFHAPFDILEARQRIQPLFQRYADMTGSEQRSAGVGAVMVAGKPPDRAPDLAVG